MANRDCDQMDVDDETHNLPSVAAPVIDHTTCHGSQHVVPEERKHQAHSGDYDSFMLDDHGFGNLTLTSDKHEENNNLNSRDTSQAVHEQSSTAARSALTAKGARTRPIAFPRGRFRSRMMNPTANRAKLDRLQVLNQTQAHPHTLGQVDTYKPVRSVERAMADFENRHNNGTRDRRPYGGRKRGRGMFCDRGRWIGDRRFGSNICAIEDLVELTIGLTQRMMTPTTVAIGRSTGVVTMGPHPAPD